MEMLNKLIIALALISTSAFSQDSIYDCLGTNVTEITNWIGDGFCDDGAYSWNGTPINFDCPEFGFDDGDCLPQEVFVPGCMDSNSQNFNPWATLDDGSCLVSECSNGESLIKIALTLDQFPSETGFIVTDISNGQYIEEVVAGSFDYNQSNQTVIYEICVPETGIEIILSDTYGDGLAGSLYSGGVDGDFVVYGDFPCGGGPDTFFDLDSANFGGVTYSGPLWIPSCGVESIEGCLDLDFVEFNPNANVDDGSCETPHVFGCVNPTMFNYNPDATISDIVPECEYTLIIEDDGGDGWGNSYIGISQGNDIVGEFSLEPGVYEQEFTIHLFSSEPVKVFYFQIAGPQQPIEEANFQTMHNSFQLINSNDITLIQGGIYPFANNGQGALQPYAPPFWNVYQAMPYCGDYCEPIVYGCTYEYNLANPDVIMFNYNPDANTYDPEIEPCIPIVEGCTELSMYGYNPNANVDDGSCQPWIIGCMDSLAWNYVPVANLNDGESCLYFGCMDSLADNYDPMANVELEGTCFTTVLGCTDPSAFNYNIDANTEDFSCVPVVFGCMDSTAFNYSPEANTEGECIDIVVGCMDAAADNYDVFANTAEECLYDAGCIGEPGNPFWLNDTCYAWVITIDPYCCNTEWDEKCQALYWSCNGDSDLDVRDLMREQDFAMYPVPVDNILNILTKEKVEIKVYNSSGLLVMYVKPRYMTVGHNRLNMSNLSSGVYTFQVTFPNGETVAEKVVKR